MLRSWLDPGPHNRGGIPSHGTITLYCSGLIRDKGGGRRDVSKCGVQSCLSRLRAWPKAHGWNVGCNLPCDACAWRTEEAIAVADAIGEYVESRGHAGTERHPLADCEMEGPGWLGRCLEAHWLRMGRAVDAH